MDRSVAATGRRDPEGPVEEELGGLRLVGELDALGALGLGPAAQLEAFGGVLARRAPRHYLGLFSRIEPERSRLFLSGVVRAQLPERLAARLIDALGAVVDEGCLASGGSPVELPLELAGLPRSWVRCHPVREAGASEGGLVDRRVWGGILGWGIAGGARDSGAEALMAAAAGPLRGLLERASLAAGMEVQSACLELLHDMHRRTLDSPRAVSAVFGRLREIFGFDLAGLAWRDEASWQASYRLTSDLPVSFVQQAKSIFLEALGRELGVPKSRVRAEHHYEPAAASRSPGAVESFVILPLGMDSNEPPGLLGLFSGRPEFFTAREVRLLTMLTPGLALCLRSGRLLGGLTEQNRDMTREMRALDHELELAREVQLHLLPRSLPAVEGLSAAGFSEPVASVGGDLYDVQATDDGGLGVFVADVAGKGLSAALLSSLTKGLLRGVARAGAGPREVLERLNRLLASELTSDRFVTAVYAQFRPKRKQVAVATAGHEPVLRYEAAAGRVDELPGRGFPLGVEGSAEYESVRCEAAPGDCFLLYTDGLLPRGEPQGREWLKDELGRLARMHRTAAPIAEGLAAFLRGRGLPAHDDAAGVVVRLT